MDSTKQKLQSAPGERGDYAKPASGEVDDWVDVAKSEAKVKDTTERERQGDAASCRAALERR